MNNVFLGKKQGCSVLVLNPRHLCNRQQTHQLVSKNAINICALINTADKMANQRQTK